MERPRGQLKWNARALAGKCKDMNQPRFWYSRGYLPHFEAARFISL